MMSQTLMLLKAKIFVLFLNASVVQVLLATSASLGFLTIGLVRGFSSPAIPSMKVYNPELVPHEEAVSWICE
uniref:Uncharacterized protein n=1 Tax=Rhodnius prolixus TaxID=13249 RepID=T1HU29_RHOPR